MCGRSPFSFCFPNSWYILGLKDDQWTTVDYQSNISFNWEMLTFNITNPQPYSSYAIITTIVGVTAGNRSSVQISAWNLYIDSNTANDSNTSAMIWNPDSIGYTSLENCQQYAVDNGYQYFGGEGLSIDQWIGSNNGSIKLTMKANGNLILYTSETKSGCVKNDKTYGNSGVNAVYKLNSVGNKNSLGKVSY